MLKIKNDDLPTFVKTDVGLTDSLSADLTQTNPTTQSTSKNDVTKLLVSSAGREQRFLRILSLILLSSSPISTVIFTGLLILTNQPTLWPLIALCGGTSGLYIFTYWCSRKPNLVQLGSWFAIIGLALAIMTVIYSFGSSQPFSGVFFVPLALSLFLLPKWATLAFSLIAIAETFLVYLVPYQPLIQLDMAEARLYLTLVIWTCSLLVTALIGMLLSHQLSQLKQVNQLAIAQTSQLQAAFGNIENKRHYGEAVGQRMASVTSELQAIANQQAVGSQQQVATVLQITQAQAELLESAGTIEGKSQTINQTAAEILQLSLKVQTTINTVQQTGQHGLLSVERTVETNQEVEKLYSTLTNGLTLLRERTDHIQRIVGSLKEISDQTHLLALNAAIEAAGVGAEGGERFGVVAAEMRGLADLSRAASKEAAEILEKVGGAIMEVTNMARQGQTQTEQALGVAQESGLVIHKLMQAVVYNAQEVSLIEQATRKMNGLTQEISLSTGQQRSATDQSVKALQQLGIVAEQSASGGQLVTQTAFSLEELSHELVLTLAV